MAIIYDPAALFEQNPSKGGVCEVKSILVSLTGATNNQLCIPSVTGKKIRVLGGNLISAGAISYVSFKSNSGGTIMYAVLVPANTTTLFLPESFWGVFETTSGTALYADNSAAVTITASLRYIEVIP